MLPNPVTSLISGILLYFAWYRRRRGLYNKQTLALFYRAFYLHPTVSVLLSYTRFHRDLGYRLSRSQARKFLDKLNNVRSGQLRQILNLLLEAGFHDEIQQRVGSLRLASLAEKSPPLADQLLSEETSTVQVAGHLAKLHRQQEAWREAFAAYLRNNKDSICVVGNSGSLIGSGLGDKIDSHRVVVRFNLFSSDNTNVYDIGRSVSVWSCSPNCTELFGDKAGQLEWGILSGPDVLYRMANWRNLVPHVQQGGKVLTIPLRVWRKLVSVLHAPPSAGILVLAWIIELLGSTESLSVAGFQLRDSERQYHQALPKHKAYKRHNWRGEQAILRQWKEQGLHILGEESAL